MNRLTSMLLFQYAFTSVVGVFLVVAWVVDPLNFFSRTVGCIFLNLVGTTLIAGTVVGWRVSRPKHDAPPRPDRLPVAGALRGLLGAFLGFWVGVSVGFGFGALALGLSVPVSFETITDVVVPVVGLAGLPLGYALGR